MPRPQPIRKSAPFRFPKALYLAAFMSGVADTLLVFYLPLHLHRTMHERNLVMVGLVVALPQMGVFLASNLWGALGDQLRKLKPLVLVGTGGYAAMLAALAFARNSWAVLACALLGSLFYSAYKPAALSFVTLREPARKGHAVAALMRLQSFGWFCGNLACGMLLQRFGPAAMAWALGSAALFGAAVFAAVALRMPEISASEFEAAGAPGPGGPGLRPRGFWKELGALYETPALAWISVVWFFTTAGRWLFFTFFAILYTDYIHGSVAIISLASSCSAMAGLWFFGPAGQWVDRHGPRRMLFLAVLGYGVYFSVNVLLTQPAVMAATFLVPVAEFWKLQPQAFVGYIVAALFIIPIYPAFVVAGNSLVASVVGRSQRAGGMGVITGVEAMGAVAGALCGGWAGDRFGVGVTPAASTVLAVVAFILAGIVLRRPFLAREPEAAPVGD